MNKWQVYDAVVNRILDGLWWVIKIALASYIFSKIFVTVVGGFGC